MKTVLKFLKDYKIHFFCWAFIIVWEVLLVEMMFHTNGDVSVYATHYADIILLVYLHAYFIKKMRRRVNLLSLVLLSFVLYFPIYIYSHKIAQDVLELFVGKTRFSVDAINKEYILRNAYRGFIFWGFSWGFFFLDSFIRQQKKSHQLQLDKLNALMDKAKAEKQVFALENAYLRSQINPHFLFNTLDFIHYQVDKAAPEAGEAVIRLGRMMRFALNTKSFDEDIILGDELEQVKNLIYVQEIKSDTKQSIELYYDDEVVKIEFISMVLMTLVENIYKHGDLRQEPAKVKLLFIDGNLIIETTNRVHAIKSIPSTHVGLKNIKERIKLKYGSKASLETQEIEGYFFVKLKVENILGKRITLKTTEVVNNITGVA